MAWELQIAITLDALLIRDCRNTATFNSLTTRHRLNTDTLNAFMTR